MSNLSRREFFLQSGLYGGSLWLMLAPTQAYRRRVERRFAGAIPSGPAAR